MLRESKVHIPFSREQPGRAPVIYRSLCPSFDPVFECLQMNINCPNDPKLRISAEFKQPAIRQRDFHQHSQSVECSRAHVQCDAELTLAEMGTHPSGEGSALQPGALSQHRDAHGDTAQPWRGCRVVTFPSLWKGETPLMLLFSF